MLNHFFINDYYKAINHTIEHLFFLMGFKSAHVCESDIIDIHVDNQIREYVWKYGVSSDLVAKRILTLIRTDKSIPVDRFDIDRNYDELNQTLLPLCKLKAIIYGTKTYKELLSSLADIHQLPKGSITTQADVDDMVVKRLLLIASNLVVL